MTREISTADEPVPVVLIGLILTLGVLTGAQLGKIAPLIPWYTEDLGFSLISAGWLAAMLGVFIALGALPAGWLIDRVGLRNSIAAGVLTLTVGGAWLSISVDPGAIFAARTVEAIGYLALCIALPACLDAVSPPRWKAPVLAIWSGFVPLGFALSDFLAAMVLALHGPETFLQIITGIFLLLSVAVLLLLQGRQMTPVAGDTGTMRATLSRQVVLLAISFGAFVIVSVSMFTFMPSFVAGEGSHYLLGAGAVALCVPLGNILASVMVVGRRPQYMAGLAAAGFVVSAIAAIPAFVMRDPAIATIAALALAISGAFVASAQFAAIPFSTPSGGSVAVVFGLVSQAGGIATVFGPPVAAWIVETYSWSGLGYFLALVSAVGVVTMLPLTRTVSR